MVEVAWKQRLDDIRINSLTDIFGVEKPVIGMVHLWPLPGAPGYTSSQATPWAVQCSCNFTPKLAVWVGSRCSWPRAGGAE